MVNNKVIFKNTIILYMRMLFLMAISLYTSRVFLSILGVENYGIYNIVGGIMVLFSFINNALSGATRRFINVELGKNDLTSAKRTFSICMTSHFIIAIVIIIIGETIGLFILNHYLNIPTERMYAANWVYQLSIIGACVGIIGTPFESIIVSYEKMSIYAYISIGEAIIKLIILYLLYISPFDKLIFYAFEILAVGILISLIKLIYCRRNFPICKYSFFLNKKEYIPFLSFSGWSLFGQIAYIGSTTGVNMIVNVFCGVVMNAAIGLARQVNGIIYNCVSGFQSAFNPQLVKTHSSGQMDDHRLLLTRASKVSFFLLFTCSFPFLINLDYILGLWLEVVPEHTASLCRLMIIFSLTEAFGTPLWMSMQATGKVKIYQIVVSSINILNVPFSYIALYLGQPIESVFIINAVIGIALYIFRVIYVLPKINYAISEYFKSTLKPILVISALQTTIMLIICYLLKDRSDLFYLVTTSLFSLAISIMLIMAIGLNRRERSIIMTKIRSIIKS